MPFVRNPITWTLLPSAARTATVSTLPQVNAEGYKGLRLHIDVTADPAAASVVVSIEIRDPVSGDWKTILDSAAIAAVTTGPTWLTVYPGIAVTANATASTHIGKQFRVTVTAADTDSLTYSIGAEWLP